MATQEGDGWGPGKSGPAPPVMSYGIFTAAGIMPAAVPPPPAGDPEPDVIVTAPGSPDRPQ